MAARPSVSSGSVLIADVKHGWVGVGAGLHKFFIEVEKLKKIIIIKQPDNQYYLQIKLTEKELKNLGDIGQYWLNYGKKQ